MFNCSFLIGGTFTYDQYATLERSISKFLIFLHFESGQLDIGHRTTSPLRLSMSSCPSKINERLLILVVRSTSLQPRVDFFSSQIAHQVVHKLLANDNNNTRNREPRLWFIRQSLFATRRRQRVSQDYIIIILPLFRLQF